MAIPLRFILAFSLAFGGTSFYLFFTNINFFIYLNQTLATYNVPIVLPIPFENYYAFVYALVPASFSIFIIVLTFRSLFLGTYVLVSARGRLYE